VICFDLESMYQGGSLGHESSAYVYVGRTMRSYLNCMKFSLLGMCYILCMTSLSVAFFASRNVPHFLPRFSCHLDFRVHYWAIFRHMVFVDGFLFLVKELGLLTNPGHWVRVLDVTSSYMYIVL
jgi:hypothetical protein